MNKRDFIQRVVVRGLPTAENIDAAITHAEWLWEQLSKKNYGAPKSTGTHDQVDWFKDKLSLHQRSFFNKFWDAFGHKQGRNGAAKSWNQLGELDSNEYEDIIEAAKVDRLRQRQPHESRKWAEGWLSERRWLDLAPTAAKPKQNTLRPLMDDLRGLEMLYKGGKDPLIKKQIDDLKVKIDKVRNA